MFVLFLMWCSDPRPQVQRCAPWDLQEPSAPVQSDLTQHHAWGLHQETWTWRTQSWTGMSIVSVCLFFACFAASSILIYPQEKAFYLVSHVVERSVYFEMTAYWLVIGTKHSPVKPLSSVCSEGKVWSPVDICIVTLDYAAQPHCLPWFDWQLSRFDKFNTSYALFLTNSRMRNT
jgi:hypothetical protein